MTHTGAGFGRSVNAARLLGLMASPVFTVMALVTVSICHDVANPVCAGAEHASALSGMPVMYLLMAVFNSGPWMTLIRN